MSINLIRIDDRLIHGQVIIGWTRSIGINTILVIDNEVINDKIQCSLLKMVTPVGVKSKIMSVDDAVSTIENYEKNTDKTMILVNHPKTILELVEKGVNIKEINVGNMRSSDNKIKLVSHVYATNEDIVIWKKLDELGVKMIAQILPDQQKIEINSVLEKI